ncbi:structural maintenance of chromosomes protein [Ceratobasidium sp. AG-Ba]|nr:structural maintenance of chromosomes protein [Ceratobasidium sp. AG-Ba]
MPPRRTTRPSAGPQAAPRTTAKSRKAAKAEPIVVEDNSESDGIEEIASPPKPAAKARRGRPPKNVVKEEEEDTGSVVEEAPPTKAKGKAKASAVVPAKRRSNKQVVGEQSDKENTAGETTPVEDAPRRTVRRTSRQPSVSRSAPTKPTSRKASGGRRKRGEEEDEEENVERPVKRASIKEEPEPQSEPEQPAPEPEVDELKHDKDAATLPTPPPPESPAEEESATPEPPTPKPASKAKGKGKAIHDNAQTNGHVSQSTSATPSKPSTIKQSQSPLQAKSQARPSQSKSAPRSKSQSRRDAIPESDTEEERDLLAEVAATPLKPRLGARESMSMSAAQMQQLSSQVDQSLPEEPKGPKKRLVIHKIALVNFKSYAGRQEIGPFHKSFSAIVGPNGSGKSNTIDALLFVFGYRATKMRQGKLSELIHNSAEWPDFNMCSVEVWFREIVDLPGDAYEVVPNSRLIVSRTAYKNNKSEYTINARPSNYTEVTALLKSRGIDLDHKRFLILQGEVESIAQMKAKAPNEHEDGLLEYLEDIIGTSKYKEPIEEALQEADRLAEERNEKAARLKIVEKEKAKLEAEKVEAETFLRIQNDYVRAQSKMWQYNIFKCQQNVAATKEHIAALKAELEEETTANAEHIRLAEELEAKYAEQRQAFQELESSLAQITKSLKAQTKIEVGLEEKRKHIKAKQKKLQKGIADDKHAKLEAESAFVNYSEQIEKSTEELAKLEKSLLVEEKELEVVANSLKGKTQVFHDKIQAKQAELAPWQQKISEQEGILGVMTSERDALVNKGKSASQAVENAAASLQELKDTHEVKETELETAKSERGKLRKELQDAEKTLHTMGTRVEQLKGAVSASRNKRDEAKASNSRNTSQGAVLDTLMKLKSAGRLQGFHGRLGSLGTIPDKYDAAVTTAATALNNMVVDTVEQAQACIDHLRRSNAGRANFFVLQKLNINPRSMEKVQTPNGAPRLFDLITPKEDKFRPAFYMALRDTLVTDTLEQAEKTAYSGPKRWRVVTLNGQLIDLSGTMSGGGTSVRRGGMSSKLAAEQVSAETIRQYEKDSEEAEQEYGNALSEMRSYERRVDELKRRLPEMDTTIRKLEMDIQGLEARIKDAEKSLRNLQNESKPNAADTKRISALEKSIASTGSELEKLRAKAAVYQNDINDLQEKILEVGGVKLRSQRSKVEDIKGMIQLANEQIVKAESGKTKSEKDSKKYDKSIESNESALGGTEAEIASLDADLQACQADLRELQAAVAQAEQAKETYDDSLQELKKELDEKLKFAQSFRAREQELNQQISESEKELKSHKQKSKEYSQLHSKLELKDVDDEDDEDEDKPEDATEAPEADREIDTQHNADEQDENVEPKIKDDPDGQAKKKSKKHDPMELQIYSEDELSEMQRERLAHDVALLEDKMGNMKPNLDVIQEYRKREAEYLARAGEFEMVTKQRDDQKAKYEELRKRRLDEFMAGFNIISSKLKEMYQMITLGGNAELDLVDSMDPFSEGVNFSVMPPKKSWKNISNLSGGEKTLSSLALVFALHVFKPTPLYFMDEIDAALDFRNVSIVANYIKDRTKDAQFIIISLRNDMFELSHRLVGIYKTANATRSICIDNKPLLTAPVASTQNGAVQA